ncbi:MAG: hypothetical protein IV107_23335 [Paucibacter sp.]|nr:hypothetical protein [Roseateles sp.]
MQEQRSPLSDQALLDCVALAAQAAEAAARSAARRLRRQPLSPTAGRTQVPHGYADLIIIGFGAEIPALARLGLIAPAGQGLWRLLAPCRFGSARQPLTVALAAAAAAAQVLSGRLPHLCIGTRSFALSGAA